MLLTAVFFSLALLADSAKPPSTYFKICHREEPGLSECVKNTLLSARESLIKGIPELNLVSLDPLFLPLLDMSRGFGLKFLMKNTTVTGLKDFKLNSLSMDKEIKTLNMTMFSPEIKFNSDYEMEGRILTLPIKGQGKVSMTFYDVTTSAYNTMERYKKNGKEYNRVKSLRWEIRPSNAKSSFTGLFDNDKQLGEATNRFLNENWKETYEVFKEIPEETFAGVFLRLTNNVLEHYTFDEWYPK